MAALTAIDLFAGCGGLTLGLKEAGFKVIGAIEIDPLAAATYRRNHRRTKLWQRDIRKVPATEIATTLGLRKGELDLLAGCPPCQGFSTLRTLNGSHEIADPRNELIFEFLRIARKLAPKTIMLENVPGLAKDERLMSFAEKLERSGYYVDYQVLDVSRYGIPQRRRRTVLIASRQGPVPWAAEAKEVRTVRHVLGDLKKPGASGDPLHDLPTLHSEEVREIIKQIPKNGGSRSSLSKRNQLACHKGFDGFADVYGRMAWNKVAPTITSGCINPSKGRFLHPSQDRAITLREAALLQGFPEKYWFSLEKGKYAAAQMIGNALPPGFAKRHACEIRRHLAQIA